MSEQVEGLDRNTEGTSKKLVNAYESAWLGRWTRVGSEAAAEGSSRSSHKEDTKCSKESSVVHDSTETGDTAKESHQTKPMNEGWEISPFPMFNLSNQSDCIKASRFGHNTEFNACPRKEATTRLPNGEDSGSKDMTNREKFSSNDYTSIPQNPRDFIRTMRFSATVDSVEGNPRKPFGYFQSPRNHADSLKLKGKMSGRFLDLFPNLHIRRQEEMRLRHLERSKDSEEGTRQYDEVIKGSVFCAKTKSMAETDLLDMDNFQRARLLGSIASLPPKFLQGQVIKTQSAVPRIELPDMNHEPPVDLDWNKSMDGDEGETNTSETQSMNIETFFTDTELRKECKRAWSGPEPCNAWVKRLKTQALSGEKADRIFFKIMESEPRDHTLSTSQIKNKKLGCEDITLKHPWIQRWCKSRDLTSRSYQLAGQEFGCEPEACKEITALEQIQKKQLPSIAAIALMGKALRSVSPSDIRKHSSLIVWYTRDLR